MTEAVAGALDALGRDGSVARRTTEPRLEEQLGRFVAFVAPVVVQSLGPEELCRPSMSMPSSRPST